MRSRKLWIFAILVVFGVNAELSKASAQNAKVRVAIYPFDQTTVQANIQKEVGTNISYGQVAADLLISALAGRIDVINRDQIKRLLEEQGRRYDEHFDISQAPEFGKLLGVDAIVAGSITSLNVEEQANAGLSSMVSAVPGIARRIPKIANTSKSATVEVGLSAVIISTATGKTLGAPHATGIAKKGTETQMSVNGASTGVTNTSKSGPDAQIRSAIAGAVDGISQQFATLIASGVPARLPNQVLTPATPVSAPTPNPPSEYVALPLEQGNVVKVEGDTMIFLVAPGARITIGEMLEIQHPDIAKNPRTGKAVAIGTTLGTLKVSQVSADQGRGHYSGKPASDQDRLVRPAVAPKP